MSDDIVSEFKKHDGGHLCADFSFNGVDYSVHCDNVVIDKCDCGSFGIHVGERTPQSEEDSYILSGHISKTYDTEVTVRYISK